MWLLAIFVIWGDAQRFDMLSGSHLTENACHDAGRAVVADMPRHRHGPLGEPSRIHYFCMETGAGGVI